MEAVRRHRSEETTRQRLNPPGQGGCMDKQNTFLLVGNASCLNRGCEAILRGTVRILRTVFEKCRIVNANFDILDPPYIPAEPDPDIVHRPLPLVHKRTAKWVVAQAAGRVFPALGRHLRYGPLRREIPGAQAILSIGGDNYSLDYGVPWIFVNLDRYVLARGRRLIIWGASVGPFDREASFAKVIHDHLRREVAAIFVREERSRAYLARHGISESVHVMPDPAFVMDAEPVTDAEVGFPLPDGAIGVNLSPLMARYVTNRDAAAWETRAVEVVRDLLKAYDRPIVLVPHVTSPNHDDHLFLTRVKSRLPPGAVLMLPRTLSAAQTKHVISRLSCLVAARTHATIAAFSTCVPTVTLAYSVKAWGINEALFGHTRYVIGPADLTPAAVTEITGRVLGETPAIRECLAGKMEGISREALEAGHTLKSIIARNGGATA